MKNDARFFFCFTGFIGFSLFYLLASVLHDNFAFSLFHGAIGCLFFAIYGRFLLGILLRNSMISSPASQEVKITDSNQPVSNNSSIRKTQPRQISANENSIDNDVGQPTVDEKV